jgi:hypothetical protein
MSSSTVSKLLGRPIQEADMPHRRTKGYEARSNIGSIVRQLDDLIKRAGDEEIVKELEAVKGRIAARADQHKSQPKPAAAQPGATKLNKAQLRRALTDSTGLSGWTFQSDPEQESDSKDEIIQTMADEYDIAVDPKDVQVYQLQRNTEDRSELFWVVIAAVPGGVYLADWATDRVSGGGEFYKSLDQLLAAIDS